MHASTFSTLPTLIKDGSGRLAQALQREMNNAGYAKVVERERTALGAPPMAAAPCNGATGNADRRENKNSLCLFPY